MGTVEQIARCKWPSAANETQPHMRRHWLYDAGMLNRAFGDFIFRVEEDGVTGNDFEDGAIPDSKFTADLTALLNLADGSITTRKLVTNVLSAETNGRAKMADLFLTTAKIEDASVTAAKLATAVNAYTLPIGAMIKFAGETLPEGDWLICAGQTLSIASYPALYAALGALWGTGGTGTFKLPDMRGYFARDWDHAAGNDPDRLTRTGGDHVGSMQNEEFHSHGYNETDPRFAHRILGITLAIVAQTNSTGPLVRHPANGGTLVSRTIGNMSPSGTETRPKNKAVLYMIRAK